MPSVKPFLNSALSVIYPPRCVLCDEIQPRGFKDGICPECRKAVPSFILADPVILPAVDSDLYRVYSIFRYDGIFREATLRFKYDRMYLYDAVFAGLVAANPPGHGFDEILAATDCLVPVPLHKSRRRERGFNQAGRLAERLSKIWGVGTADALVRHRKTGSMFEIPVEKRPDNVRDAFGVINGEIVRNKNLLIIDDIYTTGATAAECARTLKKAGAGRVCALTFTRAGEKAI